MVPAGGIGFDIFRPSADAGISIKTAIEVYKMCTVKKLSCSVVLAKMIKQGTKACCGSLTEDC